MKREKKAFEIIREIIEIENAPTSDSQMAADIATMRFKIRSLSGNFSRLSFLGGGIIRSLWKIGKIDEIVSASFDSLETPEKEILIDYLDGLEEMEPFAGQFDNVDKEIFTLEVFRDNGRDRRIN